MVPEPRSRVRTHPATHFRCAISAARFPLRLSCAETCCGLRRALEPAAGYAGLARRRGNDGLWIKAPTPPTITPGFYGRVG